MNWKTHEHRVISQEDYDQLNTEHKKFLLPTEDEVTHEVGGYDANTSLVIPLHPLKARESRINKEHLATGVNEGQVSTAAPEDDATDDDAPDGDAPDGDAPGKTKKKGKKKTDDSQE